MHHPSISVDEGEVSNSWILASRAFRRECKRDIEVRVWEVDDKEEERRDEVWDFRERREESAVLSSLRACWRERGFAPAGLRVEEAFPFVGLEAFGVVSPRPSSKRSL